MSWKRLPFIACVVATVFIYRSGASVLFGFAATVAFANLISIQFSCALGNCAVQDETLSITNPASLSALISRITGIIGFALFGYALLGLYWKV